MSSDGLSPGQTSQNPIDLTSSPAQPSRTIDLTASSPQPPPRDLPRHVGPSAVTRKPLPNPPYRSMLDVGPEHNVNQSTSSTLSRSQSHNTGERDPRLARRYLPHHMSSAGIPGPSRPEVRTAARQHSRSSPAVPVLPPGPRPPHNTLAARQNARPTPYGGQPGPSAALWDDDATPRTFEEMMQQAEAGYRRRRGTGSTGGNDRSTPRRQSSIRAPWQPDEEVTQCARCSKPFGVFNRRHHCRKCGLVVCNACSTHRIMMPRRFISQPSEYIDSGSDRDDLSAIDELETVRVCDPCVPDPNYGPPPGAAGLFMPMPNPLNPANRQFLPGQPGSNHSAMPQTILSGSGSTQSRRGTMPSYPAGIFDIGPPPPNRSASLSQSHQPSTRLPFASHQDFLEWQMNGMRPPQQQRAPSPPRPRVYPNMAVYKASEKDAKAANDDEDPPECVICLCEFEVGEDLALLECFCKFHKDCIIGWWDKDGTASCPTHKLRED